MNLFHMTKYLINYEVQVFLTVLNKCNSHLHIFNLKTEIGIS